MWNFHVWVEVMVRRPDLGQGPGWQVIDATPQENSGGFAQLGPASVLSVRLRQKNAWDADFVLSEVDANRIHMVQAPGSASFRRKRVDTRSVGIKQLTKRPGSNGAIDISNQYKTVVGSAELFDPSHNKLFKIGLKLEDNVIVGQDLAILVAVGLVGKSPLHLTGKLEVSMSDYRGEDETVVADWDIEIDVLDGGWNHTVVLPAKAYQSYLSHGRSFVLASLSLVAWDEAHDGVDTRAATVDIATDTTCLIVPLLDISIVSPELHHPKLAITPDEQVLVVVVVKNPLGIALTDLHLQLSLPNDTTIESVYPHALDAHSSVALTLPARLASAPQAMIAAAINSRELSGMAGEHSIKFANPQEQDAPPLFWLITLPLVFCALVVMFARSLRKNAYTALRQ